MNVDSRLEKLERISVYTLDQFIEAIRKGAMIHDIDITRWTLQAQQQVNLLGFKIYTNGLEDLSLRIKLYLEKLRNL